MDPVQQQQMSPQQEQMRQAQLQTQAQQGLGTPPEAPFEYKQNPSMVLMDAHVNDQIQKRAEAKEQEALAARAEADKASGYAGYKGDPSAGLGAENGSAHPNEGWSPSSPEAHNLNVQLADRIKSGSMDPRTAMIAIQHQDVSPEIKQALGQIIQQAQVGAEQAEPQDNGGRQGVPQQDGSGLGSVPLPQ